MHVTLAPAVLRRTTGRFHRATAVARWLGRSLAARLASTAEPPISIVAAPIHPLGVTTVDDPGGRMRLVGVRGVLDQHNVGELLDALADTTMFGRLHLDLHEAELSSVPAMQRLETVIDELELRRVRVRVVGLDPANAALVPPTPR